MGKRLLSAAVGIALLVTVLFVSDDYQYAFNAVVGLLAALSVWEVFSVAHEKHNTLLLWASMAFAAFVPFTDVPAVRPYAGIVLFCWVVLLLAIMLAQKGTVTLPDVTLTFMLVMLVPYAFSMLVLLRDLGLSGYGGLVKRDGVFLLLLALGGAWLADSGAYFIGRFFGKHKLAPTISPKKTVEGFVGGVAANLLLLWAMGTVYQTWLSAGGVVNMPLLLIYGFAAAFLGTLGDLSASYVKRACHVKDFGNIMPGHGGVLDRFDSILLVAPFLYLLVVTLQPVWPLVIR